MSLLTDLEGIPRVSSARVSPPAPSLEQHSVLRRTPDVKQPSTFSLLRAGNILMLLLRLILLYLFDQPSCGFSSLHLDFFNVAFSERIGTPF